MNKKTLSNQAGFSMIQLLVTLVVIGIVSASAVIGIATARAHIRRSNSARQFAMYVERARADAVRRHGQATIQQINNTTYAVTMDFSGSGTVSTQNFSTERGVTINIPIGTITFDWRGRIPQETNVKFSNELADSANVNISGSGDVTIDLEIFADGSVPDPTLNGTGGGVIPDPGPTPASTPTPAPTPTPTPNPNPTPTPNPNPTPTPYPNPTPTPNPNPTPTPNPNPTPTPNPTPSPGQCSIVTSPDSSITISQNGSGTVSVHLSNFTGNGSLTATSSNNGQIQVTPATATVNGSSSVSFTISVKRASGSVTFTSPCGNKTVTINVQ